jgi:hypothetical protein
LLKNRNKKILITLLFLVQTIFAQTLYEFDVNYGIGSSELSYNSVPGFAISIYPIENIGFSAGLQYSWRWQSKTDAIKDSLSAMDNEGDFLFFKYSIDKYRERWSARILQVPLLLKYSNDLYYVAAGVKIGAVLKANANVNYSELETEGYYPKYNLVLSAPAYQGFGVQEDSAFKTKISSKNLIMLALEGGLKLKLNDNFAMLAGVFADYSFNKGFNRNLGHIIKRAENENSNGAILEVSDRWKSWKPWSIGAIVKLSFAVEHPGTPKETFVEELPVVEKPSQNHNLTVVTEIPVPPVLPPHPEPADTMLYRIDPITGLPEFMLSRKADFVFYYPDSRTIPPPDSFHLALISQIADILREKDKSQLHCVGYSEILLSESVAYETAFQRALSIRFTLVRFYGITENRIFIYSQGLKNTGYKRAECFIFAPNFSPP